MNALKDMEQDVTAYVADILRTYAASSRSVADAHRELLGRPEREVHEQSITYQTEVARRLEQLADNVQALFAALNDPQGLAALPGILGGAWADTADSSAEGGR